MDVDYDCQRVAFGLVWVGPIKNQNMDCSGGCCSRFLCLMAPFSSRRHSFRCGVPASFCPQKQPETRPKTQIQQKKTFTPCLRQSIDPSARPLQRVCVCCVSCVLCACRSVSVTRIVSLPPFFLPFSLSVSLSLSHTQIQALLDTMLTKSSMDSDNHSNTDDEDNVNSGVQGFPSRHDTPSFERSRGFHGDNDDDYDDDGGYHEINYVHDDTSTLTPSVRCRSTNDSPTQHDMTGTGILIVSGAEEQSSLPPSNDANLLQQRAAPTATDSLGNVIVPDLSVPGTDSMPSQLDSIDVGIIRNVFDSSVLSLWSNDKIAVTNTRTRRLVRWCMLLIVTALLVTLLMAFRSRSYWKSEALRLQQDYAALEQQYLELQTDYSNLVIQAKYAADFPDWDDIDGAAAGGNDNEETVLLDNCWVKASANIKFGDCTSNARECFGNFADSIYKYSSSWFGPSQDGTDYNPSTAKWKDDLWSAFLTGSDNGKDSSREEDANKRTFQQSSTLSIDSLTQVPRALMTTTSAFSQAMVTSALKTSQYIDDTVLSAVEQTRDAIQDANFPYNTK